MIWSVTMLFAQGSPWFCPRLPKALGISACGLTILVDHFKYY